MEPELCDRGCVELVVLASIAQSSALFVTVRCVGVAGRLGLEQVVRQNSLKTEKKKLTYFLTSLQD